MEKPERQRQEINPTIWMVTFSDLLMLLLTFFVMLLSMSSMDTKLLQELMFSFRDAAGVLELSSTRGIKDVESFIRRYKDMGKLLVIDQHLIREMFIPGLPDDKTMEDIREGLKDLLRITDDDRGIVFSFQETILFDPGKAELRKEAYPLLDKLADAIEACPQDILIMGHTDALPIQNRSYDSNWELSMCRAISVLDYFVKGRKLLSSRFSVGGYGPSRPLYPNDTPRNRALNRRVEIIFRHTKEV